MIYQEFETITSLWENLMNKIWTLDGIDYFDNNKLWSFNNFLIAKSCEFNFDLSHVGYTKGRWTIFLGEYVPREKFRDWIKTAQRVGAGEVGLTLGINSSKQRGPCASTIIVRKKPCPSLVFFSRTSGLPARGALDLSLCSQVGSHFRQLWGVELKFCWASGSIQWWSDPLIAYLQSTGQLNDYLEVGVLGPTLKKILGNPDPKLFREQRFRLRAEQLKRGELPPLPVKELPFLWRLKNTRSRIDLDDEIYKPGTWPKGFNLPTGNINDWKEKTKCHR